MASSGSGEGRGIAAGDRGAKDEEKNCLGEGVESEGKVICDRT